MSQVVTSRALGGFNRDGVYAILAQLGASIPVGPDNARTGFVGPANWGAVGVPTPFSGTNDLYDKLGSVLNHPNSLTTHATLALTAVQGSKLHGVGVRTSDGTETPAVLPVLDNTGFATDTITGAGVFTPGEVKSVTLTPVSGSAVVISYTVLASDVNLAGVLASIAAKINASPAVQGSAAFLQPCTATATTIPLTALVAGASQNAIGVATTGTGLTLTAPALFSGGVAPGVLFNISGYFPGSRANGATYLFTASKGSTTASPLFDLTLTMPLAPAPERFTGIAGYAAAGGGFSAPSFIANVIAAINSGIANQRGPSKYFIASTATSPSTQQPLLGVAGVPATLGTDGLAGFATVSGASAIQQGVDGVSAAARRGMYSLRGQGCAQFVLCGVTDLTSGPAQQTLANDELSLAVGPAFPYGSTDADAAAASKQAANIVSAYIAPAKDWIYWTDTANGGIVRFLDPLGEIAGIIGSLDPWLSPGNKPYQGVQNILGTERTAYANGAPYGDTEAGTLTSAGILFLNAIPRSAALIGLTHGQNASSAANPTGPMSGINWTRLTNYFLRLTLSTLGQFVDELQGTAVNDDLRNRVAAALNAVYAQAQKQKALDSFSVINDLSVDTPVTIQQGFMLPWIQLKYLATVRFIVPTLQAGNNVQISTGPLVAA